MIPWLKHLLGIPKHLYEWERPIFSVDIDNGYGVGEPIGKRDIFQCVRMDKNTGLRCPKLKVKKYYYGR